MKRTLCALATLALLIAPVWAQDEPEGESAEGVESPAMEILKKADTAIQAVESVKFTAESKAGGIAATFLGYETAEGTVIMSGWNEQLPEEFWFEIEGAPAEGDAVHVVVAGNGENYYVIDHTGRKAYEDMDPGVLGSSTGLARGVAMRQFVQDEPYQAELAAETMELLEPAEVDGEPCHVVQVVYPQGRGKATWYFSTEDYLPRRRMLEFETPQGSGTLEQTLANIEPNYAITESMFTLELPEGYEQIDDFAP